MTEFGVYVHWPFCAAKCPYCDFNSHVRSVFDEAAWLRAIAAELAWVRAAQGDKVPTVRSIFFGGGTPSLMAGRSAAQVLDAIGKLWPVDADVEITLEANPASADAKRFADYRRAGINRISLGIQSLDDAELKFLGRLHNAADARRAIALATRIFDHVSLDLIYARPGQSADAWRSELRAALAFGTEHLSLYQLTIEPATPFALEAKRGTLVVPDEDSAAALFEITQAMTDAAGLPAYEISNHATPGRECRHNLIYWHYGDYAGVGPGAHGRLTLEGRRFATASERLPERWQQSVSRDGHGYVEISAVEPGDAAREHLLMNLRLAEGIDLSRYRERWGVEPDPTRIAALADAGFVRRAGNMLCATPRGRLVLNAVIEALAE
jgi:oxygen-independent coproporphyrinogen-3 oxidase